MKFVPLLFLLIAQAGRLSTLPAVVQQVRTALGHGAVDDARRISSTTDAPAAAKDLASALVDIFVGADAAARTKLQPLAAKEPLGEAALELGLLEMRHGNRDAAQRLLDPLVAQRPSTATPFNADDYFRLARASRAEREFFLANDAYKRVIDVPRADIQAEWGDMLFERHSPADAMQSYQAALKADPNWIPALLGVARALADEDPPAANAALESVRKLAPDHPDLWFLLTERQLDGDDRAAAKTSLDRVAKVRPGSVEEAAWRVAVAYADRKPAEVDAALAHVHELNASTDLGYRMAGEQAARNYRFDDAAGFARKAVELDSQDALAQFDLGLYLLRIGDEKSARTALETSWSLDKSNPVTKNLLDSLDKLDKFDVVTSGEFIFKFPTNEAAVLKPYALPLAEKAYKTYVDRYGFKPSGPILIEVFSDHDDFAVRTTGLTGIVGALGACFGRVISMDSPRAHPQGVDFSWHATLWHEMAHVFTLQLSDYRVPRWLTEGISVFEEYRMNPAWGREITLEYAHMLGKGKTFGVKGLPEAFKHPENYSLAYFEASLVVEHLVALNGDAGLRTLLKAYADGANDTEAFSKAFGKSIDDVEASYKAFIEQRYAALRDAMKDPPSDVDSDDLAALRARATAAPGNYISQISYGAALVKDGDFSTAKPVLEKASQLAPPARGDSSPRALLAQIDLKQNDTTQARKDLRALLAFDHSNINAARKLAELAAAANATEDLDFALRLVADLNPFDPDTHGPLGKRELAHGNRDAALTEFQVAVALNPTNPAEAHADVAEVLLGLGRKDEAKREALLALMEAPTYARAQDLLLAAIGRN